MATGLSLEEMLAIIAKGESVMYQGRVIRSAADLPSSEEFERSSANVGSQAVTADALALNDGYPRPCHAIEVQNDSDSAGDILIGDSTGQSYRLSPTQATVVPCADVNEVFIKRQASGSTATVNWKIA